MDINSSEDLKKLKDEIQHRLRGYKLQHILLGLRTTPKNIPSFAVGGTALLAVRHCKPGHPTQLKYFLPWEGLAPIVHLVTEYLLADPITYDRSVQQEYRNSNPVFTFLRIVASQMPYAVSLFARYAQPLVLYQEIPKEIAGREGVPKFDFETAFKKLNKVSLSDFLKVGFTAFAAAQNNDGITRGYFEKARSQGISLPTGKKLSLVLDQLAASPETIKDEYQQAKLPDRRFQMYDFNPLFLRPLIRPWPPRNRNAFDEYRMIAPLPGLIAYRTSTGIFYNMFNHYGEEFSKYFGLVFEAYVGRILKNCVSSGTLFSEIDIRKNYPSAKGKVPDWVIIQGKTAILIECKATRFSRGAVTTGDQVATKSSLKQVLKGLGQLQAFKEACLAKKAGLEFLNRCTKFESVFVSLEAMHLINSKFFRTYIDGELGAEGRYNLSWHILSVEELEMLQPHLATGINISRILNELKSKPFSKVLEEAHTKTGQTFKDSFLFTAQAELYKSLGVQIK